MVGLSVLVELPPVAVPPLPPCDVLRLSLVEDPPKPPAPPVALPPVRLLSPVVWLTAPPVRVGLAVMVMLGVVPPPEPLPPFWMARWSWVWAPPVRVLPPLVEVVSPPAPPKPPAPPVADVSPTAPPLEVMLGVKVMVGLALPPVPVPVALVSPTLPPKPPAPPLPVPPVAELSPLRPPVALLDAVWV